MSWVHVGPYLFKKDNVKKIQLKHYRRPFNSYNAVKFYMKGNIRNFKVNLADHHVTWEAVVNVLLQ